MFMLSQPVLETKSLYDGFQKPITALDCGDKCAPFNGGTPFCCDTCHTIPVAYPDEWRYLQANTELWRQWEAADPNETARLQQEAGPELILIECQGHERCQREFRSFVCRSFPFFPYFDSGDNLLGLTYYWEYQDRCWVISHLDAVTPAYQAEFMSAHRILFNAIPSERDTYRTWSADMRQEFASRSLPIPLLCEDGHTYEIDPHTEDLRRVRTKDLPKFGPYEVAARLPFPDEI